MQPDGTLSVSVLVANVGGVDAHEVVQVRVPQWSARCERKAIVHPTHAAYCQIYVTVPTIAGLVTPVFALKSFQRVWLPASGPPVVVNATVSSADLVTTHQDGSRSVTGGLYTVWVSGHLPTDPVSGQQSNTVSAQVEVAGESH